MGDYQLNNIVPINDENCEVITGFHADYFARLTGIHAYTDEFDKEMSGNSIAPCIKIKSKDGVVSLSRTFNLPEKYIYNGSFDVVNNGMGIGRRIFKKQIEEAKKENYTHIECVAVQDSKKNGHYTWARFGYIIDEYSKRDIETHLQEKGYAGNEIAPHLIVKTQEGRDWWKANGKSWIGEFLLENDSESMMIFRNYLKDKGDDYNL